MGQGCVTPGSAKITFGTGGMLDMCLGPQRPTFDRRGGAGTFPIVCWRHDDQMVWGLEAVMLSAGTNVEWLRDDLGLIATSDESEAVAASVPDTDGVVYVPALLGLGTPRWDYGARGALLGLTRGSGRAHVVRAVLEGVAERGADLVEAAEADSGVTLEALRIDGGMSANPMFVQHLADATQKPVEVSPVKEATTLGAGFLAGLAVGTWDGWSDLAATWRPVVAVEPGAATDRDRWKDAVERAAELAPGPVRPGLLTGPRTAARRGGRVEPPVSVAHGWAERFIALGRWSRWASGIPGPFRNQGHERHDRNQPPRTGLREPELRPDPASGAGCGHGHGAPPATGLRRVHRFLPAGDALTALIGDGRSAAARRRSVLPPGRRLPARPVPGELFPTGVPAPPNQPKTNRCCIHVMVRSTPSAGSSRPGRRSAGRGRSR